MKKQIIDYIKNASSPVSPCAVKSHFKISWAQLGQILDDINSSGEVNIAVNDLAYFEIKNEEKQ